MIVQSCLDNYKVVTWVLAMTLLIIVWISVEQQLVFTEALAQMLQYLECLFSLPHMQTWDKVQTRRHCLQKLWWIVDFFSFSTAFLSLSCSFKIKYDCNFTYITKYVHINAHSNLSKCIFNDKPHIISGIKKFQFAEILKSP